MEMESPHNNSNKSETPCVIETEHDVEVLLLSMQSIMKWKYETWEKNAGCTYIYIHRYV